MTAFTAGKVYIKSYKSISRKEHSLFEFCRKFRPRRYGKLELGLGAPLGITEEVPRGKVRDFMKWMER